MPRIIVIDDEKNICRTVSMVLMGEDYDVETASSAEDGLAQIQADAFDVAILDVQLGGMSGIELLEKLHKFPQAPEVIMMSGHAMLSDAVNATRRKTTRPRQTPTQRPKRRRTTYTHTKNSKPRRRQHHTRFLWHPRRIPRHAQN